MCLRKWVEDAIDVSLERIASPILASVYDLGVAIKELIPDPDTQRLIRWSILKPPMSIWGWAAKTETVVTLDIYLRGEQLRSFWTEKGFGLRVPYNTDHLKFKLATFGEQIQQWITKGVSEPEDGELIIGGFAGDPANVIDPGDSIVKLCTLFFEITTPAEVLSFGITDLVDDLEAFQPKFSVVFTKE